MFKAIIVILKRLASIERRININTLNLSSKFLLQCLQSKQIITKD